MDFGDLSARRAVAVPLRRAAFATTAIAIAVGMVAAPACSGGADAGDAGTVSTAVSGPAPVHPDCADGGLTIGFNPMYSAFDGTHTYQVPAVVYGSDQKVTWFADSAMVGMQADLERPNEVLLTMLGAGTTTIHVQTDDGKCGSAPLTISAALDSDWEIGRARYNDGVSLHVNGTPAEDGGSPLEQSGQGGTACNNCHGITATQGPYTNVSHTPEQTGGFSDSELLDIILHGTFPPNAPFDNDIVQYPVWQNFHRWDDITADQQHGIIVYLRSITPAPQHGQPNFGFFATDAGATPGPTTPADASTQDAGGDDGGLDAGVADGASLDASAADGEGLDAGTADGADLSDSGAQGADAAAD
jgi:hypothetical protein